MGVLVSNETGAITTINAGWWIRVDDMSRPALWSGTMASNTRVPATLALGSRIWVQPNQAFEHMSAEDSE